MRLAPKLVYSDIHLFEAAVKMFNWKIERTKRQDHLENILCNALMVYAKSFIA